MGESRLEGVFERSDGVNNAIGCRGMFSWMKFEAINVGGIGCATGALIVGGAGAVVAADGFGQIVRIGW